MAYDLASQNHNVLFLSLEMTVENLIERLFCNIMEADNFDLLTGGLKDKAELQQKWQAFEEKIKSLRLLITCGVGQSFEEVNFLIEMLNPKPEAVFVDYIQAARHLRDERLEMNEYIRKFRELCLKNKMAGVLCSQINRRVDKETNYEPSLENLKGSGVLEEHCLEENTLIYCKEKNKFYKIKDIYNKQYFFKIKTIDLDNGKIKFIKPNKILKKGKLKCLKIKTKSGKEIIVSEGTQFYNDKWHKIEDLKLGDKIYIDNNIKINNV